LEIIFPPPNPFTLLFMWLYYRALFFIHCYGPEVVFLRGSTPGHRAWFPFLRGSMAWPLYTIQRHQKPPLLHRPPALGCISSGAFRQHSVQNKKKCGALMPLPAANELLGFIFRFGVGFVVLPSSFLDEAMHDPRAHLIQPNSSKYTFTTKADNQAVWMVTLAFRIERIR
jgi:hypothetical protein